MKRKPLFLLFATISAMMFLAAAPGRGDDAAPPAPAPATVQTDTAAPAPAPATTAVENPAPAAVASTPAPAAAPAPAAMPAEPPAAATPAAAAPTPAAAEAAPAAPLRRLDAETPATAETGKEIAKEVAREVKEKVTRAVKESAARRGAGKGGENERVAFLQDVTVGPDETADAAVSIVGSTTVNGHVNNAAVSILGSTTVNGSAGDAAVSIMGDTKVDGSVGAAAVAVLGSVRVNGTVKGEVVAVGGDVELGPKAVVKGEVVVVGGVLHRDPGAVVKGGVQQISVTQHFPSFNWLFAWMKSALFKGRLLSFASGTGWAWLVAGAFLGLYALLALLFPRGIEKCAEVLEQRPGGTILAGLLTMLALPLLFLLLAVTGVGILVIPFLATAVMAGRVFGRAAMRAWLGRRLAGLFRMDPLPHAAVTVLLGGVFVLALYLVPIVALMVAFLIGFLGLGMVVYTLILTMRRNGAAKRVPAAAVPGGVPPVVAGVAPGAGEAAAGVIAPVVAVAGAATTLPRAGFWIRVLASFLDAIVVLVAVKMLHIGAQFLLIFAIYCAVLWALKGTTIGGVICGLQIVRLDDRKVDWGIAIVRTLAGFLSLAAAGLGFIWTAFDDERQSWHDKIAGTTIVKVPKGMSLI